jgi:putative nucleotidyltransferase with HDIG domain
MAVADHPADRPSKMPTATKTQTRRGRPMGRGGHRLAEAFDALDSLPALAETTARVIKVTSRAGASVGDVAELVESDTAVTIAVMRAANNGTGSGPRGRAANVADAVESLTPRKVGEIARGLETYELLTPPGAWDRLPERFRRHAVSTRHAAEQVASHGDVAGRDELAAAALLHDIGQLVLTRLYPAYGQILDEREASPEDRTQRERRELGIDHTLVGGVLARRWGLPPVVAGAIERHHSEGAQGLAAGVRLADMIAHHAHGNAVSADAVADAARACGIGDERLRQILYEFPHARAPRQRRGEPCPLSRREIDALRGLAEGKVYKEIATEMGLSASTVRTHLHNVYRKIGATDRAQAVLVARERGWV